MSSPKKTIITEIWVELWHKLHALSPQLDSITNLCKSHFNLFNRLDRTQVGGWYIVLPLLLFHSAVMSPPSHSGSLCSGPSLRITQAGVHKNATIARTMHWNKCLSNRPIFRVDYGWQLKYQYELRSLAKLLNIYSVLCGPLCWSNLFAVQLEIISSHTFSILLNGI